MRTKDTVFLKRSSVPCVFLLTQGRPSCQLLCAVSAPTVPGLMWPCCCHRCNPRLKQIRLPRATVMWVMSGSAGTSEILETAPCPHHCLRGHPQPSPVQPAHLTDLLCVSHWAWVRSMAMLEGNTLYPSADRMLRKPWEDHWCSL